MANFFMRKKKNIECAFYLLWAVCFQQSAQKVGAAVPLATNGDKVGLRGAAPVTAQILLAARQACE